MSTRRYAVDLTPEQQRVVIEALNAAAKTNEQVARTASREADDDKSNAMIVSILREAQTLTDVADTLGTPWEPEPPEQVAPEDGFGRMPEVVLSVPFELEELSN